MFLWLCVRAFGCMHGRLVVCRCACVHVCVCVCLVVCLFERMFTRVFMYELYVRVCRFVRVSVSPSLETQNYGPIISAIASVTAKIKRVVCV